MKSTSQPAGRFHLVANSFHFLLNGRLVLVLLLLWLPCHEIYIQTARSTAISTGRTSTNNNPTHRQTTSETSRAAARRDPDQCRPPADGAAAISARDVSCNTRKLSERSLDTVQLHVESQQPQMGPAPTTPAAASSNSSCPSMPTHQIDPGAFELEPRNPHHPDQSQFGFTQTQPSDFVKPRYYTLMLQMDPNKPKFTGQLMITMDLSHSSNANANEHHQERDSREPEAQQHQEPTGSPENSTRYLTLHAGAHLTFRRAFYVITGRPDIQIPVTKIGRNLERELLTLDFHPNSIQIPSQGRLLFVYSGLVNQTDSHGLFLHRRPPELANNNNNNSGSPNGSADELAGLATHLEPSFARRLFPCWDEPHLKAFFNLIVTLPFRGYETLSNKPVKRKSILLSCSGESLQEIEFETTPIMSTYLLTLVVAHLDHIESITLNNCKIRAYFYANSTQQQATSVPAQQQLQQNTTTAAATSSISSMHQSAASAGNSAQASTAQPPATNQVNQRRQQAQMALDLAVRSFDFLESLLRVKYPLAKFDMIAIKDFDSGGMENWGAALFQENYLLCDNTSSNVNLRVNGGAYRAKRLVVPLVVAHEIVHQWFGNLLTSRTWTYLWLKEGFAQLLMYEVAQALHPDEPYWGIFLSDNRRSAMLEDEFITSSRALELGESSQDPMSLYDKLTYNKGAMLLRMVQFAYGPREFFAGLRHYLLKHSYDSVVSHDLWSALEESSSGRRLQDKQLEQLMSGWLSQEGFPLVSVRLFSSPGDQHHYKLELRQERFTLLPPEASSWPPSSEHNESDASNWASSIWSTPVTLVSELWPQPDDTQLGLWPTPNNNNNNNEKTSPPSSSSPPLRGPTSLLLSDKSHTISLPKAWVGKWLKFNYEAIGYFRLNYETPDASSAAERQQQQQQIDLLELMKPAIRDGSLSPMDRFNVIEDLFAMVLAGRKSLVFYLRFLQDAYSQESDLLVLRFIFESLERIRLAIVSNAKATIQTTATTAAAATTTTTTNQMKLNQFEANFDRYVRKFVRKLIGAFKRRQRRQLNNAMSHHRRFGRTSPSFGVAAPSGGSDQQQTAQFAAFVSLNWPQQQQQQQRTKSGNNNSGNSKLMELLELLDATLLTYSKDISGSSNNNNNNMDTNNNEAETPPMGADNGHDADDRQLPLAALQLFARHFRQQSPIVAASPQPQSRAPLDAMGRELRVSIYSAALNHKQPVQSEEEAGETLAPVNEAQLRAYVTSSAGQLDLMRQQMRAAAAAPLGSFNASSPGKALAGGFSHEDLVFSRLLHAYELAGSATERAALAQSLGSTRNLTKQVYLLNLTLTQTLFRLYDSILLIDAIAHTQVGRQLIWLQLNDQSNLFKQRQLLSEALRSVSRGLIEMDSQQQQQGAAQQQENNYMSNQAIERQLRGLYAIYGAGELSNLIGQCIEWVRINTLWFRRDHQRLAEFLVESANVGEQR